jgi:adenine C2-methylase RlmN of 23S rRNA A2503 and tRNA A37
MPATEDVVPSIFMLKEYGRITKKPVEIHYALIKDLNDSTGDMHRLGQLLKDKNIPV